MDEKLMVREQERLAREKKKKKNQKKRRIVGAVLLVVVAGGVWYLGWGRNLNQTEEATVQIETGAGQTIVYADLTSVKGNEITYLVAKEQQADSETSADAPQRGEGAEMPDMGEMPEGMEKPDMGERPEGMEKPDMGEMSDRGGRGDMGGMFQNMMFSGSASTDDNTFTYDGVVYEVTEESVTTFIPVGTDVVTKLGTVTTFSRLAAGDKVALVVEEYQDKQVIAAVYIID